MNFTFFIKIFSFAKQLTNFLVSSKKMFPRFEKFCSWLMNSFC